jgi:membrane associated rhomboid family serine protease
LRDPVAEASPEDRSPLRRRCSAPAAARGAPDAEPTAHQRDPGHPRRSDGGDAWRYVTAAFLYPNAWYQLAVLLAIGIFGWRLELRHGPILVVALFLACGIGGNAIAAAAGQDILIFGAPGAAMGMLAAWAVPDVLRARNDVEHDGDLLGTAVIGVTVAAMPAVVLSASAIATFSGLLIGALAGLMLVRGTDTRR